MEELETIVQRMIDAGESEDNIKLVIEEYTKDVEKTNGSQKEDATVELVDTASESENGSSELPEMQKFDPSKTDLAAVGSDVRYIGGTKNLQDFSRNILPSFNEIYRKQDLKEAPVTLDNPKNTFKVDKSFERKNINELKQQIIPDFETTYSVGGTMGTGTSYTSPRKLTSEQLDNNELVKSEIQKQKQFGKNQVRDISLTNFFSQSSMIKNITKELSIQEFAAENPKGGDLRKEFKSYFESLPYEVTNGISQEDADEIFQDVFAHLQDKEKQTIKKDTEQIAVNDAISKGIPLQELTDSLNSSIINTYGGDKNFKEQQLALINEKERKLGKKLISMSLEEYEDMMKTKAKIIDDLYYEDEFVEDYLPGGEVVRRKTGKRIPKKEKYKMFHDLVLGHNIENPSSSEATVGTQEITDLYETFLSTYKNTSLGSLEKINDRLLIEEAGYDIEGKQKIDVKVTDPALIEALSLLQHTGEVKKTGAGKFEVTLNALTAASADGNKWWSIDAQIFNEKIDELAPADGFEGKPYSDGQEFLDYLNVRRRRGASIKAEKAALWKLYHLNEDITSIGDSRWGRFFQSTLSGLGVEEENIPKAIGYTDAKVQDVISQSILPDMGKFGSYNPETGVGLSEDQSRYLERDFSDKLVETAGGLTGMTPGLIGLNKVQGVLGINRLISSFMAPKYFVKGKQLSNTSISKFAISKNKSVDDLVTQGVITKRSSTVWEKAQGIIIGGVAEDLKMREGMGALGMQQFERGVGFGFFAGSRLLPYDFRTFEVFGKKRNQLNTFLNLTAKNGPAFAIAAEAGEVINATIEDLQGNQEFMTFVKKHWGDYGENLERTILHLITGTGLGAFHLKKNDIRTTNQISQFNQLAAEKMITSEASLKEKAIEQGIKVSNEQAYAKWLNKQYSNNDPLAMEAVKYQQDFMMSMEYLSRVNDIDAWTDPVKGQKLWNEYFEPVRQEFLKQGKELVIKFSDKPLRQEYVGADGKLSYNESSALYTRLSAKEGGSGKAIVEVYIPAGKGRGTASHEMLHAYLDLMFEGRPKLKEAFESSLRETLQKVTLLNGESLFNAIVQDQALVKKNKDGTVDQTASKQIRFEEIMAYTAEYLAKAENQNLYDSRTLSQITKFFNNFSKSVTGKNADLYTGKDLVNLLAHYGKTGKISDLKKLEQYVELGVETSDVLASAAEGKKELATKAISDYSNFAKEKGKENTELFKTKPEGYKELMAKNVEAIKDAKNNIETIEKAMDQGNPKTELNKNLFEQVVDPTTKEVSFRPKFTKKQINKELADGKGEAKDAMFETQRQAMNTVAIENLIKQGVVGDIIPKNNQLAVEEYVLAVKERLENKFRSEFNPEKNDNVFGWFTGTSGGGGKSIIFRAKGDVMNKYNKQIKTTSKEVIEGFDSMFADNTGGGGSVSGEAPLVRQRFTETVEYKQEALDIIENAATRENIDVDGLTYKDVKNLVAGQTLTNGKVPTSAKNVEATGPLKDILEVVGEKHGIPLERILANQTLTSGMRNKAREVIFEEVTQKIDALPEGTTPSGKSTGIANTKLGEFYAKGDAVKMAKTGSKQGLAEQSKQDILKNDFLELFGIKPDGTMIGGTKFDGAIREYLKQEASIIANQAARQYAGKPEAKIGEGRSIKMASVLRDKFIEKFPELNVEQIRDKFLYKHHGVEEALTKAERDFFKTSEFDKVIKNREDAIAFALMESRVVAGKTKQFKFESELRGDKYSDITLNNGLKIDGKKINLLDISATTRVKDGQTIVDVPKVKEMIKHSLNVAELLPASLSKNKSLFTEMLFMHFRTNLEGYSKESRATRLAEGKKDIITETGESVAGLDITKSKDKAVNKAGLREDVLREIWKDVVIEFNSATSQVTGAKKVRQAKTDVEVEQIAEKYFSQLSERSKESVYDAMGKTLEYYVKEAKTEAEFLSRAEYVMRGMRSNTNLRMGFRQLAPIIAVYKGKAIFDANQLKLEHLKTSAAQSYKAGQLIVSGQWSNMGKQTLKDFVGVLAPKELLNIIDAKGGKTNIEALYRMAMLEPATLKDFVTIESSGKENLLDYVLREGRKQLSRDAIKEALDAKNLLEATNKNIQNGTGIKVKLDAQLASRTQKEIDAALALGRVANKKSRGGSFFDFDETLVDKGKNFIVATKGNQTVKISSGQWPLQGPKYAAEGWKFDFKDFVNVRGGVEGPLFKKFKERLNKFGPEHMYIVTARPAESAPAIHSWLKSKGVEIPLKNITGLGNSTGEAKALYMLKKFSEGYNDMYFVDDALPNVKAVKNVLSQLDIKSDVQQAIASRDFNKEVNDILEYSLGVQSKKVFSKAEAKVRGKDIKRRRFFMPDSASDLELLLEPLYGKGQKGIENKKWFEENFVRKWERGINDFNNARQAITNDYLTLRKKNKDVVKQLPEAIEGTNFTTDMAMRVYIWNKNGYTIPDLTPSSQKKLVSYIINNPKLQAYAENVARLTKVEGGLKEPSAEWWGETIASEIQDLGKGIGRKKYIQDFIESKNEIFSEANLNKMESKLGSNWRETIEDMFDRMETGRTRSMKLGKIGNQIMNYLNGSTGAIMNFNTRSATLQLISTVNFVNSSFNNPLRAGQAFANQPQYWKDFMFIMNSDMLKQRRQGLEINVSEAELASAASESKNPAKSALAKILKAGYLPTKVADSFAIAAGGATYYRNAVKKYTKEGLSKAEAEKKAFIDFQAIAERTQQSSRADLLSKQQTSLEGRLILPFANTPMQMNRIMIKDMLDLSKGRYKGFYGENSLTSKMSRIGYYGFVQSLIFAGLQSGAFALMTNSDDDKKIAESKLNMLNTVADSFLRGMGIQGAIVNGIRLSIQEFIKQDGKTHNADYSEVAEKLLNISPTVGSKFSKLDAAGNTYKYNKKVIQEEGLTLNGPLLEASTQVIEATTNAPLNRYYKKGNNIQNALDDSYYNWQRVLMGAGWSSWGLGPGKDKERTIIVNKGKENEYTRYLTKEQLRREKVEETVKQKEKKAKKAKQQQCTKIKSDGRRCKVMVNKPKTRCHYHD